jgi:hypothetical protein
VENQVRDVVELPLERLEAEITEGAAHVTAGTGRWLLQVAEFDRRKGYERWECRSTAQWLNWHCGISLRTGHEQVRVARALVEFPATAAAVCSGALSYSKARAITRVVTPATEAALLEWAPFATAAQMERIAAGKHRVDADADADADDGPERYLTASYDEDGSLVGSFRLSAEEGAAFLAALTQAKEALRSAEHSENDGECSAEHFKAKDRAQCSAEHNPRITNADAFSLIVETMLASDPHSVIDRHERTMVMLHLYADGSGHLHDGPAVSDETAKRISCDAPAFAVTHAGSEIVNLGRTMRVPSRAQRRALLARDGGCRFPGCVERRYVQAHHVIHWVPDGLTDLDNLVLLCWRHHHAMHEGGYSMAVTAGAVTVWRPDGSLLQSEALPVPSGPGIVEQNEALGIRITAESVASKWEGPRGCDYGMAIDALLGMEARARREELSPQ